MARRPSPKIDDPRQGDLFETRYEVRAPRAIVAADFDTRLRRAVSDALYEARKAGKGRARVAAEMAEWLGNPKFSEFMLNQYSAESNETHNINVKVFMALVRATGCLWLLDVLAEPMGCLVLCGDEARDAELGRVRRQMSRLKKQERVLMEAPTVPVPVSRRRRS